MGSPGAGVSARLPARRGRWLLARVLPPPTPPARASSVRVPAGCPQPRLLPRGGRAGGAVSRGRPPHLEAGSAGREPARSSGSVAPGGAWPRCSLAAPQPLPLGRRGRGAGARRGGSRSLATGSAEPAALVPQHSWATDSVRRGLAAPGTRATWRTSAPRRTEGAPPSAPRPEPDPPSWEERVPSRPWPVALCPAMGGLIDCQMGGTSPPLVIRLALLGTFPVTATFPKLKDSSRALISSGRFPAFAFNGPGTCILNNPGLHLKFSSLKGEIYLAFLPVPVDGSKAIRESGALIMKMR